MNLLDHLVSVIVPAFNAERYVGETLTSVLSQTHANLDVIVVDDGSDDATCEVVRGFSDPRIRLFQQEKSGACVARNMGLTRARGDYVQYLDADDLLALEKIELQLERLHSEPAGAVANCSWARFRDDDLATAEFKREHDWKDYDDPLEWLVDCGLGRGTMPVHTWLIPRKVAEDAGPWNEALRINQDGEYNARLVIASSRMCFVSRARVYYRSGLGNSVSGVTDRSALDSLMEATDLIAMYMLARADTPPVREAVAGLYMHVAIRAYPAYPDITRHAEELVEQFGGSRRSPGGGRIFRFLRDAVGWKPAMRLQLLYRRLSHKR